MAGSYSLAQRLTVEHEQAEPDVEAMFGTQDPAELAAIAETL